MSGTIEYKGVKLFPVVSEEDDCFCVSLRWADGSGGYCRGETVKELREQVKASIDSRLRRGKTIKQTMGANIRRGIGEKALAIA